MSFLSVPVHVGLFESHYKLFQSPSILDSRKVIVNQFNIWKLLSFIQRISARLLQFPGGLEIDAIFP